MLKQSCFGESATGTFASCATPSEERLVPLGRTARGATPPSRSGVSEACSQDGTSAQANREEAGISKQDVAVAEAVVGALERAEDEVGGEPPVVGDGNRVPGAFSEAVLNAPLPKAVEDAARVKKTGSMRKNEVSGPAMAAAPRTRKVKPADPRPAEGEVSISFEVHRDSAATRAAKAQKKAKGKRGGLFHNLFGKPGDGDA